VINSNKHIEAIHYLRLKGQVFAVRSIGPLPASLCYYGLFAYYPFRLVQLLSTSSGRVVLCSKGFSTAIDKLTSSLHMYCYRGVLSVTFLFVVIAICPLYYITISIYLGGFTKILAQGRILLTKIHTWIHAGFMAVLMGYLNMAVLRSAVPWVTSRRSCLEQHT
jgi:F0F1-type ATP synthase assembly protein I